MYSVHNPRSAHAFALYNFFFVKQPCGNGVEKERSAKYSDRFGDTGQSSRKELKMLENIRCFAIIQTVVPAD